MTLSGLVFFQAIGCFPVSVSLVRFAWRAFEGQELPLQCVCGTTSSLPCAYLWATAMLTCLYIPIQLNIARFSFPALAPVVSLGASSSTVAGCERR